MLQRRAPPAGPQTGYNSAVAKTKIGRPRRAAKVADELIALRLTKAERRAWQAAADKAGLALSEWLRQAAAEKLER